MSNHARFNSAMPQQLTSTRIERRLVVAASFTRSRRPRPQRHVPARAVTRSSFAGTDDCSPSSQTHSILPNALEREGGGLNAGGASAVVARLRSGSRIGSDMYLRGDVGAGFGRRTLVLGRTRTPHWRPCSPAAQSRHIMQQAAGGGA